MVVSARGGAAGVPESRNTPGMLPVLSLPIFTAIGGSHIDFKPRVQNGVFFLKKSGFWETSFVTGLTWAASRITFLEFVDVCRANLYNLHISKQLLHSCSDREIL